MEGGVNPAAGEKLCVFLIQTVKEKANEALMEKTKFVTSKNKSIVVLLPRAYGFV